MTTVAVVTLGCKVNQFESESLMDSLDQKGYCVVPAGGEADIVIINTCTVTQRADFQSRQLIRRALRSNPDSLVIVTGCYSQVASDAIGGAGRAYFLGNGEKAKIPDLLPLMRQGRLPRVQVGDISAERILQDTPLHAFHRHTRAFLKIQDGCNSVCSYCIVPRARGPSRSLPPEKVLENLARLKERGFREVVLTGIHIGGYGSDLTPVSSLKSLLERIERADSPGRVRLSSIEPLDFSADLLDLLSGSAKVCPHIHIPVQSGDDAVLERMNRGYGRSYLIRLIREIREKLPGAAIGTDVIAGFPGESEERFASTLELLQTLPFSYLHVFPYSRRRGTPASTFPGGVDGQVIRRRAEQLRQLGKEKRLAFYQQFLNRNLEVLIEGRAGTERNRVKGLSKNYIPVLLSLEAGWVNRERTVRVAGISESGVTGEVVEEQIGGSEAGSAAGA